MVLTAPAPAASYEDKLADIRSRLNGRAYCTAVHELLPDLSKAQIRNLANGRGENPLFLSALEIVVHKMEARQRSEEARLKEEAQRVGLAA